MDNFELKKDGIGTADYLKVRQITKSGETKRLPILVGIIALLICAASVGVVIWAIVHFIG